ncbi:MAG: TRAP transporter substrate-binding protein DctP [Thermodesulfobacteriota bacterium]
MEQNANRRPGRYAWLSVFLIFLFSPVLSAERKADNLPREDFQSALNNVLSSLWTGQAFTPEIEKKRALLKDTLKSGAISEADLKELIRTEMSAIIHRYKTSRYILEEIPDRFNDTFSPLAAWDKVKEEIVWGVIAEELKNKEPFVLKLATLAPEGTPWMDVPQTILVPRITQLTGGALRPKFYTGGVMGEDNDVLRKMDIGQLDGCGCTTLGVVTASPDASVFMAPDLFRNYDEIDYICVKFRRQLDESFEKRGYICGAIIDSGFLYVFSKKKIAGLDDLKKQKALTSIGHIELTMLEELGVDPVPVAIPEVVSALSTGLADTFIAPAAWALGMQAYQYVNYYITTPFFYSPGVVLLSDSTRDKIGKHFGLPEAIVFNTQELIVLEIKAIEPEWKKRGRIYEEKSLKAFEVRCGIHPVTLSPRDQETFEQAARKVRENLAGKDYPRDLLDDVLASLEAYRKKR